jgi:hypothetical protein
VLDVLRDVWLGIAHLGVCFGSALKKSVSGCWRHVWVLSAMRGIRPGAVNLSLPMKRKQLVPVRSARICAAAGCPAG